MLRLQVQLPSMVSTMYTMNEKLVKVSGLAKLPVPAWMLDRMLLTAPWLWGSDLLQSLPDTYPLPTGPGHIAHSPLLL